MKAVVGFSGGVSSAWCAGWALRTFPKSDVVFLFHDTKEEDTDTYRFIEEMAKALNHPIEERSDGRSVTQLMRDEGALANNRMAFCSRILKAEQRDRYFKELRSTGEKEILNVLGFSEKEPLRIQRAYARGIAAGFETRFPMAETGTTKQQAADWCLVMGVKPPKMYIWSEHANCVGCVRGGKAYWLSVAKFRPDEFEQRCKLEEEFGHTVLKDTTLRELVKVGLKRRVTQRESIVTNCQCGD